MKRPLGRPSHRWKNKIKISIKEVWRGLDSSGSEEGPVAGYECGNGTWSCIKAVAILTS
jgi:hypothetical protein